MQVHSLNRDTADFRTYAGTNPGAGNNYSIGLPQNAFHQILQVQCLLTTDANAANRVVVCGGGASGTNRFLAVAPAVQTASTAVLYSFQQGVAPLDMSTNGLVMTSPIGDYFIMHGGFTLNIDVVNIQVGDAITAILYSLRTWYY